MILENNSVTKQIHEDWRQRIKNDFPEIDFSNNSDYLCLINYLDKVPQKFYSRIAFKQFLHFLENIKLKDPRLLADILLKAESMLSLSNKILTEVNGMPIHDVLLPTKYPDLINFIDKEIHYNLLKVYETPLFQFSKVIAKYYWLKDNKGIDGLDLYNAIIELKKHGFDFVESIYMHDVRNGIGHGKIVFSDLDITYIDKKGNKTTNSPREVIDAFDGTLDITNGFCLAFKIFSLTNLEFFDAYQIPIPQSILLEELQARTNAPAWTIINSIESEALHNKRQLIIYIKNDFWDVRKVQLYCFSTAYWAEKLTKSYDRIFLSINSIHAKITSTGWAIFNGNKLKELRGNNETRIELFSDVLEDNLIFFIPKINFPRIIYKIGTFLNIIKATFPLAWRNYIDKYFPSPFFMRETQIHSRKFFSVIQDPSVVIKPNFQEDVKQLVLNNRKKIVNQAIQYSRKQCSIFSLTKYLPVKYIRVFIYDTDKRIRNLRYSGLIPDLVATIEVNRTKHIRTIDIIGGTPEQHGKYRIVWNKSWLDKMQTLRKTGVYIKQNKSLIELDKLPESGSINDITKSLGFNENQVHSIFVFNSKIVSIIVVKIFTKEVIFILTQDGVKNFNLSKLDSELSNVNWESEYSSGNIESKLTEGINNKNLTYDYLSSLIRLSPLTESIYYSSNLDLNLHFTDGLLTNFTSVDGFNASSKWLRNLNKPLFDKMFLEAKKYHKSEMEAIGEVNNQCDALQYIPNAINNEFIKDHTNSFGNYNFYNLLIVHYALKVTITGFLQMNSGRFEKVNERTIRVNNFVYQFSQMGEFQRAWKES